MELFLQLNLPPLVIGVLVAMACALPGNFLLLRRQALIGDAISHVVLPGIVAAFLLTGSVATWPMLAGAMGAALVAALLIEAVRRIGRVEPGAAMGVVFTGMFALGVMLLERSDTSRVHLDVEHALYGNLESLVWFAATDMTSLFDPAALAELPPQLPRIAGVLAFAMLFLALVRRPLTIATFDEAYARSIGIRVDALGFALVGLTAIVAVAAFEAVGSILVIAMFICPPAAARLMTNRLGMQIAWSMVFAALSGTLGYVLAGFGPIWLGGDNAVSAAGMIATVAGLLLGLACLYGPARSRVGTR